MSSHELRRAFLAAEILATGKRYCWKCRSPRDASTGQIFRLTNGAKRWRCALCSTKKHPGVL